MANILYTVVVQGWPTKTILRDSLKMFYEFRGPYKLC